MKASAVLAADVSLRAGPISTAISHTPPEKTLEAAPNPTQAGAGAWIRTREHEFSHKSKSRQRSTLTAEKHSINLLI